MDEVETEEMYSMTLSQIVAKNNCIKIKNQNCVLFN